MFPRGISAKCPGRSVGRCVQCMGHARAVARASPRSGRGGGVVTAFKRAVKEGGVGTLGPGKETRWFQPTDMGLGNPARVGSACLNGGGKDMGRASQQI